MNAKSVTAAIVGLATAGFTAGCNKPTQDATEVPSESGASDVGSSEAAASPAGEHACGNHAEGACGVADTGSSAEVAPTSREFDIEPGKFAEANFTMKKGSRVVVTFDKGAANVAWDIHSHDHSGGTKVHEQGEGGAGSVDFVAPQDGIFSILWKNVGTETSPLDVSISLEEGASIHSWMPAQ